MADGTPADAGLPSSNRGVNLPIRSVCIDWCAVACDLTAILSEQGWDNDLRSLYLDLDGDGRDAWGVGASVFSFLFARTSLRVSSEVQGGGRFYKWGVKIENPAGEFVGVIQFGGEHTLRKDGTRTVRIELTGDGCRHYEAEASGDHAKRWLSLQAKLESVGGRLTRVDLAHDDLAGVHTVAWAQHLWANDEFTAQGGRPSARLHDDMDTGAGKTFYVGAVTSEKQMRVYEKGRELGDKLSPWVRWEVQFRASNRKPLPLDMLTRCDDYMLGAYPAMSFIQAVAQRIDYVSEAAVATLKSALRHVRRQYGATLNFLAKNFQDDEGLARIVRTLTRNKVPAWAHQPVAPDTWPGLLAHATT